jgi:hypothetical protein
LNYITISHSDVQIFEYPVFISISEMFSCPRPRSCDIDMNMDKDVDNGHEQKLELELKLEHEHESRYWIALILD